MYYVKELLELSFLVMLNFLVYICSMFYENNDICMYLSLNWYFDVLKIVVLRKCIYMRYF